MPRVACLSRDDAVPGNATCSEMIGNSPKSFQLKPLDAFCRTRKGNSIIVVVQYLVTLLTAPPPGTSTLEINSDTFRVHRMGRFMTHDISISDFGRVWDSAPPVPLTIPGIDLFWKSPLNIWIHIIQTVLLSPRKISWAVLRVNHGLVQCVLLLHW